MVRHRDEDRQESPVARTRVHERRFRPAVEVKSRQVRRVLDELVDAGYLQRTEGGPGVAHEYEQVGDPGAGEVSIPDRDEAVPDTDLPGRSSSNTYYTRNVRVFTGDRGREDGSRPTHSRDERGVRTTRLTPIGGDSEPSRPATGVASRMIARIHSHMTASTDTETANVSTIQKPFNLEGSVTVSNGPATICNKKRPLAPPEKELSASERKPVVRGGGRATTVGVRTIAQKCDSRAFRRQLEVPHRPNSGCRTSREYAQGVSDKQMCDSTVITIHNSRRAGEIAHRTGFSVCTNRDWKISVCNRLM